MRNLQKYTRTEQLLEEVIHSFEGLAVTSTLTSRKLESMLGKLRSMRRSMQRLDKTDRKSREKFWMLSRRSVALAVKMAKMLPGS